MEKWGGTQSSPCPRDPRVHASASRREPGRHASGSLTEPDPPGRCGTPGTGAREGVRSPPASRAKRGAEGRRPRPAHGVTAVTPTGTESSQASVRAPRCTARPQPLGRAVRGRAGGQGPGGCAADRGDFSSTSSRDCGARGGWGKDRPTARPRGRAGRQSAADTVHANTAQRTTYN